MINFFNRAVLMHILFVTFFNLFVFHLQTDIIINQSIAVER